jgi:hypothetical protein
VRRILSGLLLAYDAYPLLKHFSQSDFDYLVRKLTDLVAGYITEGAA